ESYQARQRTNPETGQPFTSKGEYESYQARQRTNPETGQPFTSLTELKDYQARKARRRKVNRKLEELVSVSLNVLNKDLSWLAKEIGVSRQMTSLYSQGKSIPKPEILSKLFVALDTPFKTLDDLVNEDL
ncbi:helix-turn-helix transcriptional regulator, partial [Candidatus Pacearchaeota archaeon]|nr:helix-turn-helix transcriptional regulator [Candidatus Pacearchaeota archaeon]